MCLVGFSHKLVCLAIFNHGDLLDFTLMLLNQAHLNVSLLLVCPHVDVE